MSDFSVEGMVLVWTGMFEEFYLLDKLQTLIYRIISPALGLTTLGFFANNSNMLRGNGDLGLQQVTRTYAECPFLLFGLLHT